MKTILTLGIALLAASAAQAGFIVTAPGPINSNGPIGDAGNGIISGTYLGPTAIFGQLDFVGDLTEVNTGTYASEARWNIKNLNSGVTLAFQPSTIGNFTGTINVTKSVNLLWWSNNSDNYTFEAYESYNDPGLDAQWTNVSFTFSDLGGIIDLGNYASGAFDINTFGSAFDTELALYSDTGLLIATNDDAQSTLQSQLLETLGDGSYYVVLGGYNSQFINGAALAGTSNGAYNLTVNGELVSSGSLGQGQFAVFSLTIPEPGTLALLGLGLLGLVRRR